MKTNVPRLHRIERRDTRSNNNIYDHFIAPSQYNSEGHTFSNTDGEIMDLFVCNFIYIFVLFEN